MSLFSSFGNALFGVQQPNPGRFYDQGSALTAGAGQYAGQEQSAVGGLNRLGSNLWNTINGAGPSPAAIQLGQSMGQNLQQGLAMGSGASGANSVLARYLTAQGTGANADQLAQAAALLRAREIEAARAQYGQTQGQIGQLGANLYGQNLQTGLGYAQTGANAENQDANRSLQTEAAGLSALSGLGSMYFGRPPGGGAAGGAGAF